MRPGSPVPAGPARRAPRRAARVGPLDVLLRVVAGVGGGYALAACFTTTVALAVREPAEEAAHRGAVPSFLLLAGAIVWAFAARSAARAWLGIGVPLVVLATATWWLSRAAVTP